MQDLPYTGHDVYNDYDTKPEYIDHLYESSFHLETRLQRKLSNAEDAHTYASRELENFISTYGYSRTASDEENAARAARLRESMIIHRKTAKEQRNVDNAAAVVARLVDTIRRNNDARRLCQMQLANVRSDVIHCNECADASATMNGGRFYYMQYAPLTSTGPCPNARYVLGIMAIWYRERNLIILGGQYSFDATTIPLITEVRNALLQYSKHRVLNKVLAIQEIKKGAEAAPGTTAYASAMGRSYGSRGSVPFASVEDCMKTTEYDTNKRLHHFARGYNDATGRPVPDSTGRLGGRRRHGMAEACVRIAFRCGEVMPTPLLRQTHRIIASRFACYYLL